MTRYVELQELTKQVTDDCIPWPGPTLQGPDGEDRGYGRLKHGGKTQYAHRLAVEAPPDSVVMHTCDNPNCVNPRHLRVGTTLDNNRDRDEKGRTSKGESHHTTKLSEDDVRGIRWLREQGWYEREIAEWYSISRPAVSHIVARRAWAHVTTNPTRSGRSAMPAG